jgi:hypothetical protein
MNRFENHPIPATNSMMYHGIHSGILVWNGWLMIIPLAISLVVLVDLILVGVWLWKQIRKK